MTETQGTYYDGKTARDNTVRVTYANGQVSFSGSTLAPQLWPAASLRAIEPYHGHGPLRLTHDQRSTERLIIPAGEFARRLVEEVASLQPVPVSHALRRFAGWTIGGLAAIAGVAWLVLEFAPSRVAGMLPHSFTARMGKDVEAMLVEKARVCAAPAGQAALSTMVARLLAADPKLPPLTIQVYDMSLVNAFTVAGGRVVLTRGLIGDAGNADEVAGVLAHEIGHAALLHPEAQLVRVLGLDIVLKLFSGGASGNTAASVAGLAAILRSSREAERDADGYARKLMQDAHLDPSGLKTFFEALLKKHGGAASENAAIGSIGNVFSTHPGLEERIQEFKPLPAGASVKPVLSSAEWAALRDICK
jgi:Zn-dependent protease with chaperone function